MIRDAQFDAGYSLTELADAMNRTEGRWGKLQQIGNDGNSSVGVYDDATNGTKTLTLRMGGPQPKPGEALVATGTLFITGQLQQVTVYRR